MAEFDDDIDNDGNEYENKSALNRKKALIFLLPALIVIGIAVGFYHNFGNNDSDTVSGNYTSVTKPGENNSDKGKTTIFYDLPEIRSQIKTDGKNKENVNLQITIELSGEEDIKTIEKLLSKLNDIIIAHTSELTSDEISGAEGLYWLKEELLHRINLVTAPIRVENINFKSFEVQKAN